MKFAFLIIYYWIEDVWEYKYSIHTLWYANIWSIYLKWNENKSRIDLELQHPKLAFILHILQLQQACPPKLIWTTNFKELLQFHWFCLKCVAFLWFCNWFSLNLQCWMLVGTVTAQPKCSRRARPQNQHSEKRLLLRFQCIKDNFRDFDKKNKVDL